MNEPLDGDLYAVAGEAEENGFLCECNDADCRERISIDGDLYERIHNDSAHYVVLPEHVAPERDRVISLVEDVAVVEPPRPYLGTRTAKRSLNWLTREGLDT